MPERRALATFSEVANCARSYALEIFVQSRKGLRKNLTPEPKRRLTQVDVDEETSCIILYSLKDVDENYTHC